MLWCLLSLETKHIYSYSTIMHLLQIQYLKHTHLPLYSFLHYNFFSCNEEVGEMSLGVLASSSPQPCTGSSLFSQVKRAYQSLNYIRQASWDMGMELGWTKHSLHNKVSPTCAEVKQLQQFFTNLIKQAEKGTWKQHTWVFVLESFLSKSGSSPTAHSTQN